MKSILLLVTLGLATILADDNQSLKTFSDHFHNFTSEIYKTTILRSATNYALCPTTLNLFLAILYAGVNGNSTESNTDLLQFPGSSVENHQTFSDLARKLNRDDYLNFGNISKIYIQDGFQISNTYKRTLVDIFKGDIENIDFKQRKKAVKTVNSWVYENSNHLIGKIISEFYLTERSSVLFINTLNFRGLFTKNLFKEESTIKRDFYINRITSVETDMMEAYSNCSYYESEKLNARFLQLNFTNIDDGSITFILPNDKEGLTDLKYKMDHVFIKPNYSNQFVNISIPRFKIQPKIDYNLKGSFAVYEKLFNNPRMGTNQKPLEIENILQSIIMEVNENGISATWAALSTLSTPDLTLLDINLSSPSVTGSGSGHFYLDFNLPTANYVQLNNFQAHHPFMYYITINGVNIIVGTFGEPEVQTANQRNNIPMQFLSMPENKSKMVPRGESTEIPIRSIVEEYTCPCNLN